jgi:hypothetical protein
VIVIEASALKIPRSKGKDMLTFLEYNEFYRKVIKKQKDRRIDKLNKPIENYVLKEYVRFYFNRKLGIPIKKEQEPDSPT